MNATPGRFEVPDDVTAPVVVGCSGGADSLALLVLAADAALDPIAVHVDHGLRDGSAAEADVVADAAARLGTRFDARPVTVSRGPNLEARARAARYDALERARAEHGASAVLVGHTADDQAETVLLNLLRGSGSSGLAGMPSRRGCIVRPLLGMRRAELRAVCAQRGFVPVTDPSNEDLSFRRNRIRHEVIPLLDGVAGRDLTPILVRQAEVLRTESDFLDGLARAAWPGEAGARARDLAALPRALARRAVRCWLGQPRPSLEEVDEILAVASGERRAVDLVGGRRVRRSGGVMFAESASSAEPEPATAPITDD
jgi:tRNA(Ile)-lysidine synthase